MASIRHSYFPSNGFSRRIASAPCTATFVFVCLFGVATSARAELSQEEFFAQYAPAAARLNAFYAPPIKVTALRTKSNWRNGPSTPPERIAIYFNGDRVRVDAARPAPEGQNSDGGEVSTRVAGPETSFVVWRGAGQNSYGLTQLGDGKHGPKATLARDEYVEFAPFYEHHLGVDYLTLLKRTSVKITALEEEKRGDEALVKVSYIQNSTINKKPVQWTCWCLFSKDRCWALRGSSYQNTATKSPPAVSQIEYGTTVDGIPILKTAEYWKQDGDQRLEVTKYEQIEIKKESAPAGDFTLAAFGIGDVREEKETKYWLYLIVAGVVMIAAVIVLARLGARRWTRG